MQDDISRLSSCSVQVVRRRVTDSETLTHQLDLIDSFVIAAPAQCEMLSRCIDIYLVLTNSTLRHGIGGFYSYESQVHGQTVCADILRVMGVIRSENMCIYQIFKLHDFCLWEEKTKRFCFRRNPENKWQVLHGPEEKGQTEGVSLSYSPRATVPTSRTVAADIRKLNCRDSAAQAD